eukprot:2927936-Heterocapsa_arctica.AAC.1
MALDIQNAPWHATDPATNPSRRYGQTDALTNGRSNFAVPGARRKDIKARTTRFRCAAIAESAEEADNECTICRDKFQIGEHLKVLPCLHKYHTDCVDKWLGQSGTCPVCKLDIMDE